MSDVDSVVVEDADEAMGAESAWQRRDRRDAVFARKPDALPFTAYAAAEASVAQAMSHAGAAYLSSGASSIHTPNPHVSARSGDMRPLPKPVVETCSVQQVADALDPEDDADLLRTLRVVTNMAAFKEYVLGEGYRSDLTRRLRVPAERVRELKAKDYIRRVRNPSLYAFACTLFWVPKSDGKTDRTIFKGTPLNARCKRPHRTLFEPMPQMLQRLTDPEIKYFLAYDLSTWFVQLKLPEDIAGTFAVRLMDGSVFRVTGIPMGWTWAPAVAQAVTLALLRLTMRRLPAEVREQVAIQYAYIDNIIFALKDPRVADEVDRCWRAVCAEHGVAIKESDTVKGTTVDWLGVELSAGSRDAMFRKRFRDKLVETWDLCVQGKVRTVRAWWRMVALAVHVLWTSQCVLTTLIQPLRWLSRTASSLHRGECTWSTEVTPWSGVAEDIGKVFEQAQRSFQVRAVPERVIIRGQSDAAANGFSAFVVRKPGGNVTAARAGATPQGIHINRSEMRIALAGIRWSLGQIGQEEGVIDWASDNTTAVAWLQRRWSSEWNMNEAISTLHEEMVAAGSRLAIRHVPGVRCVPDVLTRCALYPGQQCRAPEAYCRELVMACTCDGLCEHVADEVRRLATGMCIKAGCSGQGSSP